MRLEWFGQLKNPMISGIEPAAFRLVTWCLKQIRYRLPPKETVVVNFNVLSHHFPDGHVLSGHSLVPSP
jgi:hypothetical protein